MEPDPYIYILFVLLVLLSAFFSASESAFSYCNEHRLKIDADKGNKRAKLAIRIKEKYDDTLITILVGNNIVNIVTSVIATLVFSYYLSESLGPVVATISTTIIVLIFGEILPKAIAKSIPEVVAKSFSFILFGIYYLIYPISIIFKGILFAFTKIFKIRDDEPTITGDDFIDVVEEAEDTGNFDEEETDIIQNAIDFGETKAKEVLTKKNKIVALDIKKAKSNNYVMNFIFNCSYSRIPVYEGSIDNVIGILHVRTYLKELSKNSKTKLKNVLLEPYFVEQNIKLDDLLNGFKAHQTHIAIVKSKNGNTIGMVTMQDVLEELIEDIDDADKGVGSI